MLGESRRARYGLGGERRLASRADFERLLRKGARRTRAGYTLYVLERTQGPARIGILISRKHAAKATVRNQIKRCIRETFRLEQAALSGLDLLVRPPLGARAGEPMRRSLSELFRTVAR